MNPRTSKHLAKLPASLDYRLHVYSLAAAAAGVGLLALADPPAKAEIIYTPAQQHIPPNQYGFIDFNHDGANDVRFYLSSDSYKIVNRAFGARASQQGGIVGYAGGIFLGAPINLASALSKGVPIGPKANFLVSGVLAWIVENHYDGSSTFSDGPWRNVKGRYLGVKFNIDGEAHYGWIRMSVSNARRMDIIVTGYAYETIPNRPILAGQISGNTDESENLGDSSLGALALGAAGKAHS